MTSARPDFHEEALKDYKEAVRWYASRDPVIASNFVDAVTHALDQVVSAPRQWAHHVSGTRKYVFPKPFRAYKLIYFEHQSNVRIVAVAHSSRKPGYWQHRLGD